MAVDRAEILRDEKAGVFPRGASRPTHSCWCRASIYV